jgi:hypothetical protein
MTPSGDFTLGRGDFTLGGLVLAPSILGHISFFALGRFTLCSFPFSVHALPFLYQLASLRATTTPRDPFLMNQVQEEHTDWFTFPPSRHEDVLSILLLLSFKNWAVLRLRCKHNLRSKLLSSPVSFSFQF